MKRPYQLLIILQALYCSLALTQQIQPPANPKVPLERLLNRDGTLDLARSFRGSIDPARWQMKTGTNGEPRFVSTGVAQQSIGAAQLMAGPGDIEWIRQFNGLGIFEYIAQVSGAAYAGKVYVVGQTIFSPGPFAELTGGIMRLYDTSGNESWTILTPYRAPYGIVADASGVYIGGMTWDPLVGDPLGVLSKYDTNGNEAWTRQFDSSSITGNSGWAWVSAIALDVSGLYVAGGTRSAFGGTSTGEFVRKYDTNGNEAWTRLFGTPALETVNGVASDGSGVYVVETMSSSVPLVSTAAIIRKYDSNGNAVWTRQFGSGSFDYATGIDVDASGVYAVGYTDGTLPGQTSAGEYDAFVRQYDTSGNEGWTRQFGTSTYDYVRRIAVDASGVYVAGVTQGAFPGQTNAGSSDVFIRKYDAASNEVWTRQFGTSSIDESNGVAADVSGVYVFGHTYGAFPGQTSSGRSDAFVVKIQISQPPTVDAGGSYSVNEGASVTVTASGSDPENGPLTYAWDLDNNGIFETPGQSVTFSAANLDGPSSQFIKVQVTDNGGLTATDQATVNVLNVAPTATFTCAPSIIIIGQSAILSFSNPFDPSAADVTAGFLYSYDCTNDGTFEVSDDNTTSHTCTYSNSGTFTAKGEIKDKDGGSKDYTVQIVVQTPRQAIGSLIDLVNALVPSVLDPNDAKPLVGKLEGVQTKLDNDKTTSAINDLQAFINMINAAINSGKLTAAEGQLLIDAANAIIASLSNPAPAAAQLKKDTFDASELPTEFQLAQNWPNPFNPTTTIQFSVPRESYVRLKVYEASGAEVVTLVDRRVAAGTYKVNWNASQLASGFYLYRLEAEGFAQTKKLLLMK